MTKIRIENAQYLVTVDEHDTILTNATIEIDNGSDHQDHDGRRRPGARGDRGSGGGGGAEIVEEAAGWDWRERDRAPARECGWSAAD